MTRCIDAIVGETREIWESRAILKSLVTKNLIGRYKNSLLGFGWHFVMPIVYMAIYYLVFSQIRQNSIPDFWIYLTSGLFAFHFLIENIVGGASCFVGNSGMIKKMYFPREIIALAHVISTFVIMIIGYAVVFLTLTIAGYEYHLSIIMVPFLFIIILIFAFGSVLIVASLTVYVRDLQHVLTSLSMAFYFLTPMYFVVSDTSGLLNAIIWANPLTYFLEALHQSIYYGSIPDISIMACCALISVSIFCAGIIIFHKLKGGFAERL